MARLGILAGGGALPPAILQAHPDAYVLTFAGVQHLMGVDAPVFPIDRIGAIYAALREAGVTDVVFAGGLSRPALDPAQFDDDMRALAPHLLAAMQQGDDAVLRLVVQTFEGQGFAVRGAHEVLPALTADAGLVAGPQPTDADMADAARGFDILAHTAALDIGQGCVVANGLCLGFETLQGTDAMLRFVSETPEKLRHAAKGGVLVKTPKAGQDLRVDMPAVGPDTLRAAAKAGLNGIVITAGNVVVLDRPQIAKVAEDAGVFLWSAEPQE